MELQELTRRELVWLLGGSMICVSITGCEQAVRVVINLPWSKIRKITKIALDIADAVLTVKAIVEDFKREEKETTINLDKTQLGQLRQGAKLVLRSRDNIDVYMTTMTSTYLIMNPPQWQQQPSSPGYQPWNPGFR